MEGRKRVQNASMRNTPFSLAAAIICTTSFSFMANGFSHRTALPDLRHINVFAQW